MASVEFFARGKLLLSGEYLVLDGAEALALGLNTGQSLTVSERCEDDCLRWESLEADGTLWFSARFGADGSVLESSDRAVAERLSRLLVECRAQAPGFSFSGRCATMRAGFDRAWGLGTSSTLIYLLGRWSGADPFALVRRVWPGSGYDVACAGLREKNALTYRLRDGKPQWKEVDFRPCFADRLFFVYSGRKQDTAAAVARYRRLPTAVRSEAAVRATRITRAMLECGSLEEFEGLLTEHEALLGRLLDIVPVQRKSFPDYRGGAVKSLGAWGGDFLLATGREAPEYFLGRGFRTVCPFNSMTVK